MIIGASFDVSNPELWLNRAMYYGDGVFETMRCEAGCIPLSAWHRARLTHSLERLKLDAFDWQQVVASMPLIPAKWRQRSVLKLVVFRAGGGRGYRPDTHRTDWLLVAGDLPKTDSDEAVRLGVATQRLGEQPLLAGIKHLNRLEQVLLADELNQQSADDLLVLNNHDEVVETTQQNLLLVKDNQLFTPALDRNGVHGVALAWLKSHFKVTEARIPLPELAAYDELMVANSVRGFRSVVAVDGLDSIGTNRRFHGKISRMWKTLFNS